MGRDFRILMGWAAALLLLLPARRGGRITRGHSARRADIAAMDRHRAWNAVLAALARIAASLPVPRRS